MGKTQIESNDTLTKKAWDEKMFRDSSKEAYFNKFMGTTQDDIVYVKNEFMKGQGDEIKFGLIKKLTGSGVTDREILEGREERLQYASDSVVLKMYRHAVRDQGKLDRQRALFSITDESKRALKVWGSEKIDQLCFDAVTDSPTKVFYTNSSSALAATGTPATAIANLHATNSKLSLDMISKIKAWAMTGGDRQQIPIRPVKVDGLNTFVLLVHPDNVLDLKLSTAWQTAQREAQIRGDKNPLFKGAVGVWDNVVIHEHENIPTGTDGGGASVPYAKGVLMGAQALVWAWGAKEEVVQETFDYQNEIGHGWGIIARVKKPQFESVDYGSLGVYLSRTNNSGL